MRVVVIEPDKPAHIAEIENSLASMQATVGGYIEVVPAEWMPGGAALCNRNLLLVMNEEGKLEDLPYNFPIQNGTDYIYGTAFICKGQEDELIGLSDEEVNLVLGLVQREDRPDATETVSGKNIYSQSTNDDSNCQDTEGGV